MYPQTPGFQKSSETSRLAAQDIDHEAQRAAVLLCFECAGKNGLTCKECHEWIVDGMPRWRSIEYGTVSARMVALKELNHIVAKNERRRNKSGKTAEVYIHKKFQAAQMALDL